MSLERLYLDALAETPEAPSSRARLLAAAGSRRRPAASVPAWASPYAGRVAAMDALLASAERWDQVVVEGWTLQELVAHLAAKDGLLADAIGAPVLGPPIGVNEALARTHELQDFERQRTPEQTRHSWRDQADAICAHLPGVDPDQVVAPGGTPFAIRDHLLARMLETWIHTDDAANLNGLRLPHPVAEHIHPTADFCARLVPWTMLLTGFDATSRTVRLTLTGPGGGDWHVPLDVSHVAAPYRGESADVTLTCDVVGFCFLLGGRGDGFTWDVEGDQSLAADLFTAAPALSGP
ncbi:TIGR03084 family protein [Acrocarpospora phusangensis]|uniref:TIGR03084 family protein n=1 Tax=Acrocarpospora phusangensis TaxID=1070424 RepID=A0A919QDQ5_9ACTN|nr:maleylpyruvate isomerase N-terminal domain-containing protein [Acrocarpospora phusangensis]GIH26843.1 TIGR03084 family protein [Acrocarpospora phusangensis]